MNANLKTTPKFPQILFTIAVVIFTVSCCFSADLEIKTSVDQTKIGLNQNFVLTIDISGEQARSVGDPDMPTMDDFAVYMGSSGTSQNIQIINGKVTVSKSTNYTFRAVTLGRFTIPPLVINHNGTEYKSNPIQIEVVNAASQRPNQSRQQTPSTEDQGAESISDDNLYLNFSVSKRNVYINEPLVLSFQIFTKLSVTQYGINKLPNTAGFWVEEEDLGNQPQVYDKIVNGKKYRVAEIKKMTIFPTDAGKKTIGPMEIECNVRVQTRRRSIFDSFFDDPFFGRSVRKLIQSKPVTINVMPLPELGKPAKFSGLVGNFSLSANVDKSQVKTNEAMALKIEIAGAGNIKMIPNPFVDLPADFEQYPPKISQKFNRNENGVSGSKAYEYVLVPRHPGEQKIKPIEFSYFDINTKQYKTLRSREIVVNVEKSNDQFVVVSGSRTKEDLKYLGKDIRFIQQGLPQFHRIKSQFYESFYFVFLVLLPIVMLISALGYRRHLDKLSGNVAYARSRRANQIAMKRLAKAKKQLNEETQKEFYAEVANALMGFLGDKLNIPAAGIITDEVEELMQRQGIVESVIEQYISCLRNCDYQRFAPSTAKIEGMKSFYDEAKQAIISLEKII